MSKGIKGTTLAVLHDEGQVGEQWRDFIQKMFTEELPEEYRDMNLDVISESVDYIGEDEACNVNNCEYKLLLLNSEVLKFLNNPESSLRRSELMIYRPEQLIVLILSQEDDVEFLQQANMCLFGFKENESYNIIHAKFPGQIFADILAILSPMYVVPHPNILSCEDTEQHLTLISNKPFPVAQEVEYVVELSVGSKTTEATASLFNPCTLLVQNPGHNPGVVTLKIFACTRNPHTEDKVPVVTRTQVGEDMKIWFQSDLDKVFSILESQNNPIHFLGQAMNLTSLRLDKLNMEERLDKILTDSFKKCVPDNKLSLVFGNAQQLPEDIDQDGNRTEYMPTLLHFAAMYGLRDLTASLLQCPGAVQAYGTANCEGDFPTNLAEKSNHWDLRDFMQTYMEVAAMVDNDFGNKGNMRTTDIMSSVVSGQYLSLTSDAGDSDDIYMRMESEFKNDSLALPPGYLSMLPLNQNLVPGASSGATYSSMIVKMFGGSEDDLEGSDDGCVYEQLDQPTEMFPRPGQMRSVPNPPPHPAPTNLPGGDQPPPLHPREDRRNSFQEPSSDPANDITILPKIPSALSPAQEELITLQQKVKNEELTINQAVFRFKEWERKHKERAASFQYQQENLQRIRNSLMKSREERKQRGESTSIRISEPLTSGTSTYDKVLLKTREAVMESAYSGSGAKFRSRQSLEKKREEVSIGNVYNPECQPFGRAGGSFKKSSFGRPPMMVPNADRPFSMGQRGSSSSSLRSSISSISSIDSGSRPPSIKDTTKRPSLPSLSEGDRRQSRPVLPHLPISRVDDFPSHNNGQSNVYSHDPAPPVPPRVPRGFAPGNRGVYGQGELPPSVPPRNPRKR